jgi:hypothetical protein|nr:MAG TPA: NTP-PPase-like protein [Caudoviricetes sp.]
MKEFSSEIVNELASKAYKTAVEHGWHNESLSDSHFLCLVISELMEAVEADRGNYWNKRAKVDWFKKKIETSRICQGLDPDISKERGYEVAYNETIKGSIEEELADAAIRLLDLAGLRKIELSLYGNLGTANLNKMSFTEAVTNIIGEIYKESWNGYYAEKSQLKHTIEMMLEKIYSLTKGLKIDLLEHIELKMKYNELRSFKHDGKKY